MTHYRGYNRSTTLSFLYYYSDMHETGGTAGSSVGEPRGHSVARAPDPIAGYVTARIDDAHQRATYEVLEEAVGELKVERWHLWMRVEALYFRDDNNPTLLDAWRVEAENGSVPDRYALGEHDDAVEFVLGRAEAKIARRGYERLKLDLPERIRGERARKNAKRRSEAVDVLLGKMSEHGPGSPRAIKDAATITGYTPKQMRVMRREIHGEAPGMDDERRYA